MKRCTSCGYELPDEAVFCSSCGVRLNSLDVEVITDNQLKAESEYEIVCKLYDLESTALAANKDMLSIHAEEYCVPKPQPPESVHYPAERYPVLRPQCSTPVWFIVISILLLIIPFLGWFIWVFIYVFDYSSDKKRREQQSIWEQKNSESYRQICQQIDARNSANREIAEQKYKELYTEYDETKLQPWQNAFDAWEKDKRQRYDTAFTTFKKCRLEALRIYDECKLFPEDYRCPESLIKIYEIMSSSKYSVKEAIEVYDRHRQMELTRQHIAAQQNTAQELAYQNSALDAQNELLYMQAQLADEANAIAEEARRDANRAAFVATVQRHNTNKALNKLVRK